MNRPRINVTKTFLPPREEYEKYLDKIWESGWLTNQGPMVLEFEEKTRKYLNVPNFHFVSNGTIALQVALSALDITEGEIITTPFSYVATTSAILWERCKPVYVDIKENTLCIDADKIEAAITKDTKAILAVHVFGFPCDVEKIEAIAKKHNIKVIYDAAHAFGVTYKGKSLLSYGDISTCSFHATKLLHTIEGGCVIAKDKTISDKLELRKRFGHTGDEHFMLGVNAKASEFHAAMGLCNLKYVGQLLKERRAIHEQYMDLLDHKNITVPVIRNKDEHNYAYFPVLLKNHSKLQNVIKTLNEENIFPRRYFYPSLNDLPYVNEAEKCPISENVADRILCLPFYVGLSSDNVQTITKLINAAAV